MKKFFSMVLAFLIIILSSFVIAGCNKVSTEDDVDNGKIKRSGETGCVKPY